MLVGFIGSPCSGKTTTAAMAFAHLKDSGISTEFIPEQARLYIARARLDGNPVGLLDQDQVNIMAQQEAAEELMVTACPDVVHVTDSSVFNSLLYLNPMVKQSKDVDLLVLKALVRYDLLFVCSPVKRPHSLDPNRIHSEEESMVINASIPRVLDQYCPGLMEKTILLNGHAKERYHHVVVKILERMLA